MKPHRKIKHNEKMCRAQDVGSYAQGQGQRSVIKIIFSNISKTTEANLTKLHGKIENNKNACRTQGLNSYAQGQGHNQVKIIVS